MTELQLVEPWGLGEPTRAQAAQLGGKGQPVAVPAHVERFDSKTVASEGKLTSPSVPNGEREHSIQALHTFGALFGPQTQDDLDISRAPEPVPFVLEFAPELTEVVDLTVEHDGKRPFLIEDRLLSGLEVDHGQAAKAQ